MRLAVFLTRTLVFLLALRAIAAPVAVRPSQISPGHRSWLEVRARCWPPQRLARFSSSSKLLQLMKGKDKVASLPSGRFVAFGVFVTPLRFALSSPALGNLRSLSADRASDRLRC